jgi:hypothetical protein
LAVGFGEQGRWHVFYTHEDLELANRQIHEGEIEVRQQERIIAALRQANQSTRIAEKVFAKTQERLAQRQQHRDAIVLQLNGRQADAANLPFETNVTGDQTSNFLTA